MAEHRAGVEWKVISTFWCLRRSRQEWPGSYGHNEDGDDENFEVFLKFDAKSC